MKRHAWWLVSAALAIGGALAGCTSLCDGDTHVNVTFAARAQYGEEMAACLQDADACFALCADVFQIAGEVRQCDITSVVNSDSSQHPATRTTDLAVVRGMTLRVVYVDQVSCTAGDDGGGFIDVGGDDGGGDDGSCDDGSCGCDDGSCDDGGGDDGGDDGGGDDGGGDDGGGDDGGGDWLVHGPQPTGHAVRASFAKR
ncbi:MAG TPA: hypothetical protein VFP84_28855 [Kofleriaceae bacterium]|nr:hypothetical protein [Kofleriaceae bacterium]